MSCWKDGLFLPHSEDIPSGFWGFPDPTCRGLTSSGRLERPQHSWVFLTAEVKLSNLGDNEVGEDEDLTTPRLAGRQSQTKVTTADSRAGTQQGQDLAQSTSCCQSSAEHPG